MRKILILIFIAALGIGLVIGELAPVYAQSDEFLLEEITVTAQKREENQQKVSITMEVLSGEDLSELGKTSLDDILSNISSVTLQRSPDGYRVAIRGVDDYTGPMGTQSITTPSVAVNMDGVVSNRYDTANLFDVERVEVLYGPQSTLYSSTSPGGIVNITTANPKTDRYEISGKLEYGNYNLLRTEGVMNAPLSDTTAMRAAFTTSVRDGFLDTGADDEDQKSARLKTLFQPNDKFSFLVSVELDKDQSIGLSGGSVTFENQDDVPNPWQGVYNGTLGHNNQTRIKVHGRIEVDMALGTLSFIPSYATGEGDMTTNRLNRDGTVDTSDSVQNNRERGFELRMISAEDFFFKWIIGGTYYRSYDSHYSASVEFQETGVGTWRWRRMMQDNKALYGNIIYPITDLFRLNAGARWSWDKLDSPNMMWTQYPMSGGFWPDYGLWYTRNYTKTDARPDYKFGFEYDLGTDSMVYGDYSTSYRVQGGMPGGTWPPETLNTYTLGTKNRFFGNKLQVNGGLYYYDYQNFFARVGNWQVPFDTDGDGETDEWVEEPNSAHFGDGRIMGFDLQLSAIITPKDLLNVSTTYINSEWTDLYCDYLYDWYRADESLTGKTMKNTPPWTISTSYSHIFNLANGGTLTARIDSRVRTAYRLTWRDDAYPLDYQEKFHMEDISAVYANPDGKWTLSAYLKNIFNYAEKRRYGMSSLNIGEPRTYGAILSVKY